MLTEIQCLMAIAYVTWVIPYPLLIIFAHGWAWISLVCDIAWALSCMVEIAHSLRPDWKLIRKPDGDLEAEVELVRSESTLR